MITPGKIQQVKKQLSPGIPEGEVRNDLLAEGYTKEEISQCFSVHRYDIRSRYLLTGILLFLIGLWLLVARNSFAMLLSSLILLFRYDYENRKLNGSK